MCGPCGVPPLPFPAASGAGYVLGARTGSRAAHVSPHCQQRNYSALASRRLCPPIQRFGHRSGNQKVRSVCIVGASGGKLNFHHRWLEVTNHFHQIRSLRDVPLLQETDFLELSQ